jgi:hypothetical protein
MKILISKVLLFLICDDKYFQPGQTKTELVQGHQIDNAYPAPHMASVANHDDTSIILTRTVCTLLVDTPCTLHLEIYKYYAVTCIEMSPFSCPVKENMD